MHTSIEICQGARVCPSTLVHRSSRPSVSTLQTVELATDIHKIIIEMMIRRDMRTIKHALFICKYINEYVCCVYPNILREQLIWRRESERIDFLSIMNGTYQYERWRSTAMRTWHAHLMFDIDIKIIIEIDGAVDDLGAIGALVPRIRVKIGHHEIELSRKLGHGPFIVTTPSCCWYDQYEVTIYKERSYTVDIVTDVHPVTQQCMLGTLRRVFPELDCAVE